MKTPANSILRRIRAKRRGWVFTPKNFTDIAPRMVIDVTLHRLTQIGVIRKLSRGIYDFPIIHKKLGQLTPNPDRLAQAIANKTGASIQPSAASAANQLGIDTQVPAKPTYLSSGKHKKIMIGNYPITLRHSKYTSGDTLTPNVANLINAIRHKGKNNITPTIIKHLSRILSTKDKRQLIKHIAKFPDWMAPIITEITRK